MTSGYTDHNVCMALLAAIAAQLACATLELWCLANANAGYPTSLMCRCLKQPASSLLRHSNQQPNRTTVHRHPAAKCQQEQQSQLEQQQQQSNHHQQRQQQQQQM